MKFLIDSLKTIKLVKKKEKRKFFKASTNFQMGVNVLTEFKINTALLTL